MQLGAKEPTPCLRAARSRAISVARLKTGSIRNRRILTALPFSGTGLALSMREPFGV